MPFPERQREILLDIAWQSIHHGLRHGTALEPEPDLFEAPLCDPGASFVTLHADGRLRGCIGSLEAFRPLVRDVAENAFAAAFRDPRFTALTAAEVPGLTLDISVLGAPQELAFSSEQDLLAQIRPHTDGLILEENGKRGTFLPSVWETLPDRAQFLQQLKLKAGLPARHWSDAIRVWRYTAECFGEPVPAQLSHSRTL
jgi:AmmeMemoRadiSam system protein A